MMRQEWPAGRSLTTASLLVLVCLLALASTVHGATYHVAPTGSDSNAGTQAAPWAHIQRAADVMVPGDIVIIAPGVYVESVDIRRSGTADAYITYQAMPGAVMESPNPSQSLEALDIWPGVSFIRLRGFELRGGFHETIFVRQGAHHIEISDCHLHHNRGGIQWYGSAHGLVERCQIYDNSSGGMGFRAGAHDIVVRDTDSFNHNDGLGCGGDADGFASDATAYNLTFERTRAFGNSEDGFDFKGSNILIDRSVSSNNQCVGVKLWNSSVLRNSLVHGNGRGVVTTSVVSGGGTTVRLVNNTIADNVNLAVALNSSPDQLYAVELFNNVLSGNDKLLDFLDCVNLTEDFNLFFRPNASADHIIERVGCVATGSTVRFSGTAINGGLWFGHSGQGANSRAADPLYAGAASDDFHPLASSPLIDAGSSAAAPAVDFDGTARPQGAAADIGAYEAGGRVTLSVSKTGGGTVTSSPAGVSCGATCAAPFDRDTTVTLTVTPAAGWTFTGWGGGSCSGTAPCTVTMSGNTSVTATFISGKDLAITGLSLSVSTVAPGSGVTVSYQVKNLGATTVTETYTERIYLSSDAVLSTPGDVLLGASHGHTDDLALEGTHGHSQVFTIPASTPPGNYFLLVQADAFGTVSEMNESNNVAAIALILATPSRDLVIDELGVSATSVVAGNKVTVSYRVANRGTVMVTQTFRDRIYLSTDATLNTPGDVLLGESHKHKDLAPNGTHVHVQEVTIPPATAAGSYFILVHVDALAAISETAEDNNLAAASLTVTRP
jgi:Divergent InlB B-repeat domain/CARDB/Right handed beta helix region